MSYGNTKQLDFAAYSADAIRTEQKITEIFTDKECLVAALKIAVETGKMIDMVKKGVIYGKEVDSTVLNDLMQGVETAVDKFGVAVYRDVPEDYEGEVVNVNPRLLHAAIGKFGEAAELLSALIEQIETGKLNIVNVMEELGDDKWYDALAFDEISQAKLDDGTPITLPLTLERNIAKLKLRFGDKFSLEKSETRDAAAEESVLAAGK